MTPMEVCEAAGCDRPAKVAGACFMHRQRMQKRGTYEKHERWSSLAERLWAKVNKTDTCWLWTGADNGNGYGQIGLGEKKLYVHRLSWEWAHGPIPNGMQVDHLCFVRHCVNPDHMEIVTPQVNINRGYGVPISAALQRAKNHCPNGHEYTPENTANLNGDVYRHCLKCRRLKDRRWKANSRESLRLARKSALGQCGQFRCIARPTDGSIYCANHVTDT